MLVLIPTLPLPNKISSKKAIIRISKDIIVIPDSGHPDGYQPLASDQFAQPDSEAITSTPGHKYQKLHSSMLIPSQSIAQDASLPNYVSASRKIT